jgi:hypothetical protein
MIKKTDHGVNAAAEDHTGTAHAAADLLSL